MEKSFRIKGTDVTLSRASNKSKVFIKCGNIVEGFLEDSEVRYLMSMLSGEETIYTHGIGQVGIDVYIEDKAIGYASGMVLTKANSTKFCEGRVKIELDGFKDMRDVSCSMSLEKARDIVRESEINAELASVQQREKTLRNKVEVAEDRVRKTGIALNKRDAETKVIEKQHQRLTRELNESRNELFMSKKKIEELSEERRILNGIKK